MRKIDVMRAALAGLLGCAVGAPGREIPVYREYTQPIAFYDAAGTPLEFHAAGPDVAMSQSMRDAKAQEAMMGKETLLDLTFESGKSILSAQPSPIRGVAPDGRNREDGRPQKNGNANRDWLVKSLALPSLGQTPTNTAASVMSGEGTEPSGWGWLASEVTGQASGGEGLPKDALPEEAYDPLAASESTLAREANPYAAGRAGEKASAEAKTKEAGSFPEMSVGGQKPSDRAAERSALSGLDLQGGDRQPAPTMTDYSASPAKAELSQTRQWLTELSSSSRPDFTSLRESLGSSTANEAGGTGRAGAIPASLPMPSAAGWTGNSGAESRPAAGWGSIEASSVAAAPAWRGGWSAQETGGGGLSRLGGLSDPVPTTLPEQKLESNRSGTSSGGYKPAWF